MKILVFGINGQLARSLCDLGRTRPDDIFTFVGSADCDIANAGRVSSVVDDVLPDGIVNAAAYTAVDGAEADERRAFEVNCIGAGNIARAANAANAAMIHVSTDYVFDGTARRPYREDDMCLPLSSYGRSKLAGEYAVRAACPRSITLRTSWVFSAYGSNFVKTMLRLATQRECLRVVDDQIGNPTAASELARAALVCLLDCVDDKRKRRTGRLYHFAGTETMSWHGFARRILDTAGRHGLTVAKLEAIPTIDYPTLAERPPNSRLDSRLGGVEIGLRHRPIDGLVEDVVGHILFESNCPSLLKSDSGPRNQPRQACSDADHVRV